MIAGLTQRDGGGVDQQEHAEARSYRSAMIRKWWRHRILSERNEKEVLARALLLLFLANSAQCNQCSKKVMGLWVVLFELAVRLGERRTERR